MIRTNSNSEKRFFCPLDPLCHNICGVERYSDEDREIKNMLVKFYDNYTVEEQKINILAILIFLEIKGINLSILKSFNVITTIRTWRSTINLVVLLGH
jgi:hypothetical protein